MKKTIIILFVLTIVLCSCVDKNPTDTVTYAHFGDDETEMSSQNPYETNQSETTASESEQTESTATEATQTETEKLTETETGPVVDPDDVHFSGFTPIAENASPVDMNGIDLSTFDEDSAEYAVYSDVGRLAVISSELSIFDRYAKAMIAQKDEIYDRDYVSEVYRLRLVDSNIKSAQNIRNGILNIISAFNVSEYVGEADITEYFTAEFERAVAAVKEKSIKSMKSLTASVSWREWQIDMMKTELKSVGEICDRLEARKAEGVSYGGYIDHLIKTVKETAAELSDAFDEGYRLMEGLDYPYPYRIERALYSDHVEIYIYPDENTEVVLGDAVVGSLFDMLYGQITCGYSEGNGRYEITYNFELKGMGYPLFRLVNKETRAFRTYDSTNLNFLSSMTDIGPINEREVIERMNPALKAAFTEAYGENFTLEHGDGIIELHLTADDNDTGIIRIELISATSGKIYTYLANVEFDEPYKPITMEEFVLAINFLRSRYINRETKETKYNQLVVWVDKGTIDIDFVNFHDFGKPVLIRLYGFSKEIKEGGGGYVSDNYFLYYTDPHNPRFSLMYEGSDNRINSTGMTFDLNFKLIESK